MAASDEAKQIVIDGLEDAKCARLMKLVMAEPALEVKRDNQWASCWDMK